MYSEGRNEKRKITSRSEKESRKIRRTNRRTSTLPDTLRMSEREKGGL